MTALLRQEFPLAIALVAALVALPAEHAILAAGQVASLVAALLLVAAILMASLRVAHHAEEIAERVGEPYGTMILTLSAVAIEVVILAILLSHSPSPTLVRDTIWSAVMLDINGILGLSALLGGLRHGEQPYNVDSGNSYIVMILVAMGVSMALPGVVPPVHARTWSLFNIVIMALMYGLFLKLQTGRHSYFFAYSYERHGTGGTAGGGHGDEAAGRGGLGLHIGLLLAGIVLVGLLSEAMSKTLDAGLAGTGVPPMVTPLIVAAISASPEIVTALRAALSNRMQPVVNIALGASLSTVILTVPVLETLALLTGHPMQMTLTPGQGVMVGLTLLAAMINIHDGETNAIEGMTHLVLFLAFLVLAALGV